MDNEKLLRLLAQTDALFGVIRDWSNRSQIAGVLEGRERFEKAGLPLDSPGGDANARKAFERSLTDLEAAGEVRFTRRRGKRVAWKLYPSADWKYRRMACFSDFPPMVTCLLAIAAHEDSPTLARPCNAVSECWLIGGDYQDTPSYRDKMIMLEECLAPALCRGLAFAWSDREGRVAYSLTPDGRDFLTDPRPPVIDWPTWDKAASETYQGELEAARRILASVRGAENHAPIPMSCGTWPDDSEAAAIPPVFTKGGKIRSPANMAAAKGKP